MHNVYNMILFCFFKPNFCQGDIYSIALYLNHLLGMNNWACKLNHQRMSLKVNKKI